MRIAVVLSLLALAVVGCSSDSAGPDPTPAPKGSTTETKTKGGLKGMSSEDLKVPAGSENLNQPGSKGGGN